MLEGNVSHQRCISMTRSSVFVLIQSTLSACFFPACVDTFSTKNNTMAYGGFGVPDARSVNACVSACLMVTYLQKMK